MLLFTNFCCDFQTSLSALSLLDQTLHGYKICLEIFLFGSVYIVLKVYMLGKLPVLGSVESTSKALEVNLFNLPSSVKNQGVRYLLLKD